MPRPTHSSPLNAIRECAGIGYAICLIDVYMGMYYNTIIGWAVYFLFASFDWKLPWTTCDPAWSTPQCAPTNDTSQENSSLPAKEYFEWVNPRGIPPPAPSPPSNLRAQGPQPRLLIQKYFPGGRFSKASTLTAWTEWAPLNGIWLYAFSPCFYWSTSRYGKEWRAPER